MIRESNAYKYAQWCVSDETGKVGRYVKKQEKKQKKDIRVLAI